MNKDFASASSLLREMHIRVFSISKIICVIYSHIIDVELINVHYRPWIVMDDSLSQGLMYMRMIKLGFDTSNRSTL